MFGVQFPGCTESNNLTDRVCKLNPAVSWLHGANIWGAKGYRCVVARRRRVVASLRVVRFVESLRRFVGFHVDQFLLRC